MQHKIGNLATRELSTLLGSKVGIDGIDISMLNRVLLKGVTLDDRDSNRIATINRLSVSYDILPLLNGKIRINTVQLFGFNVMLSKDTVEGDLNIKYIIDKFSKKDKSGKSTTDLRINYVLLRNGKLSYDILTEDTTAGLFNKSHIRLSDISANISLKTFNADSLNVNIRRLELKEHSGLSLKRASLRARANKDRMLLDEFVIDVGNSKFNIDSVWVEDKGGGLMTLSPVDPTYGVCISGTEIAIGDLAYFKSEFDGIDRRLAVKLDLWGDRQSVSLRQLDMNIDDDFDFSFSSFVDSAGVYARLERFHVTSAILDLLPVAGPNLKMPGYVDIAGELYGPYSDMQLAVDASSTIGDITCKSALSLDANHVLDVRSARIASEKIQIDSLVRGSKLSEVSFDSDIALHLQPGNLSALGLDVGFDIARLVFDGYEYDDIAIDCSMHKQNGQLSVAYDGDDAGLTIVGESSTVRGVHEIALVAALDDANLYALNLMKDERYEGSRLSVGLGAKFRGKSFSDFIADMEINDLELTMPDDHYKCSLFRINVDNRNDNDKSVYVNSDFLNAYVTGNYNYKQLAGSLKKVINHYMPVLEVEKQRKRQHEANNMRFGFEVTSMDFFNKVLGLPIDIGESKVTANGYFDDSTNTLMLDCYVPQLAYKNKRFDSSLIRLKTALINGLEVECRSNLHMKDENVLALSMHSMISDNKVNANLYWGNNQRETYSGNISLNTMLSRHEGDKGIKAEINLNKGNFILKDSCWDVLPSKVVVDSGKVAISRFRIEHLDQFIDINGTVSRDHNDSIFVDLSKIDMSYIFELANIKRVVDFSGDVTGLVYANGVLSTLRINADLDVDDFAFNNSVLGDMQLKGAWDNESKGILIDASVLDEQGAFTKVDGAVYPIKPGRIDMSIKTSDVNLGFLRKYMASISSDMHGRADGEIRIHGPLKGGINLTGWAVAKDFRFKVDFLNTTLTTSDSVRFLPDQILMDNILVNDAQGNNARATIRLRHKHLKDLSYEVNADLDRMLVMDKAESVDLPFYGKIFASGQVTIAGQSGSTTVYANVRTDQNSSFSYLLNSTSTATSNQFVTFVDKTNYRRNEQIYIPKGKVRTFDEVQPKTSSDIRLNLNIDVTPGIYLKMIMDRSAGDYIGGTGSGNIRIDFYNKGDVKMYGNYTLDKGIYKFSIQEIIRKDFIINAGSSITFNGDPLNADLDINAAYTVNSVSLQDLGSDVVNQAGQSNVKVNCTMHLTGALTRPDIKLGLELPNEGEEVQRTVLNAISTEEQMNMQILYLLSIGKFYMADYNSDNANQSSNALSSVLSSTISGQLNNMFSNLINNNNWNIGTNLSTGTEGWTDVEFEGMLSGQLLNNRLLINGNFGYRDNALSQNNFIGDFEVEYLLDRMGNFRLKAYNRTNDRYYTKTTLTTQGLGLVFKRDFDNVRDLFDFSIRKARKTSRRDTVGVK